MIFSAFLHTGPLEGVNSMATKKYLDKLYFYLYRSMNLRSVLGEMFFIIALLYQL